MLPLPPSSLGDCSLASLTFHPLVAFQITAFVLLLHIFRCSSPPVSSYNYHALAFETYVTEPLVRQKLACCWILTGCFSPNIVFACGCIYELVYGRPCTRARFNPAWCTPTIVSTTLLRVWGSTLDTQSVPVVLPSPPVSVRRLVFCSSICDSQIKLFCLINENDSTTFKRTPKGLRGRGLVGVGCEG